MDNSKQSSAIRIQEIFNNTIQKIIKIIQPQDADKELKITGEIIPILQSFLMNIQIYHSQVFNGIINGIALQIPNQSLIPDDFGGEPDVIPRFGGEPDRDNLVVAENALAGFAKLDIDDTRPILQSNTKSKPNYSIGNSSSSSSGFRDKSQNAYNNYETRDTLDSRQNIQSQTNYDDFIKTYTDAYSRYHNTYVADSSDGEDEDETWKSLNEYIGEQSNQTEKSDGTNDFSATQCCARLSKFMKYHIIDFPVNFLDAYPPDTYIEGGYVFGKPCTRKVSNSSLEKGLFLCDEHINEPSIEDIREPRYNKMDSQFANDDTDIIFSEYNQFGNYDNVDAFADGHQCCARLNKYRIYRLENESDKFLDVYPPDVYIADGCVFGSACPNLISDESFQSGIRFCIHHQSDPYVENICEPRTIHTNLHKPFNESISDLGLTEHTFNKLPQKNISSRDGYEWDKYNTDFDYLC